MTISTTEKLLNLFVVALPILFIVLSISIIGLTILTFIRMDKPDMIELQILLLLYASLVLLTGILHKTDDATIPMTFISVILGSIIIDRRPDWSILFKRNKVLTGFIGSIMLLSLLLIYIFAGSMLNKGMTIWRIYRKLRPIAKPVEITSPTA